MNLYNKYILLAGCEICGISRWWNASISLTPVQCCIRRDKQGPNGVTISYRMTEKENDEPMIHFYTRPMEFEEVNLIRFW